MATLLAWQGLHRLENRHKVSAATAKKARAQSPLLHLVAPLPGALIVRDPLDWCAEAAFVVDGPFERGKPIEDGYLAIVRAALAGYEFVPGVLLEALYNLRKRLDPDTVEEAARLIMPYIPSLIGIDEWEHIAGLGFVLASLRQREYIFSLASMVSRNDSEVGGCVKTAGVVVSALSFLGEDEFSRECILHMRLHSCDAAYLRHRLGSEPFESFAMVCRSGYDGYGDTFEAMISDNNIREETAMGWASTLGRDDFVRTAWMARAGRQQFRMAVVHALALRGDRELADECLTVMFPTAADFTEYADHLEWRPDERRRLTEACGASDKYAYHIKLARWMLKQYGVAEIVRLFRAGRSLDYDEVLYALELAFRDGLLEENEVKSLIGDTPGLLRKCRRCGAASLARILETEEDK